MTTRRYPPSEVASDTLSRNSKMRMRLPAHVWATLSCGLEAESCEVEQFFWWRNRIEGVRVRQRWREYDGSYRLNQTNLDDAHRAWQEYVMRRTVWIRRDGQWHGEVVWEAYNREEECVMDTILEVNRRWRDMGDVRQYPTVPSPGGNVPQEVLLCMLKEFNWVCVFVHSGVAHLIKSCRRDRCQCSPLHVGPLVHGLRFAYRGYIATFLSAIPHVSMISSTSCLRPTAISPNMLEP